MYYKITDINSEAWGKISTFINMINDTYVDNKKKVIDRLGFKSEEYLVSYYAFDHVPTFKGFKPGNIGDEALCKNMKALKPDDSNPGFFIPNRRTKVGRELSDFLEYQEHVSFLKDNALYPDLKSPGIWVKFGYEYVKEKRTILIKTQDENKVQFTPLPGMIEITSVEYKSILNEKV